MTSRKPTRRPRIGSHAPIEGALHESLRVASDTGCDAVQIFSRNPRGWMAKPLTKESIDLFRRTRKQTKLSPVLIHTNYLINLAAADETIRLKSIASFREEVERAILLGVDYLVLHPGSARGSCEPDAIKICGLSLRLACEGHIGREALCRFAQHPKLAHAAFILETPYDDPRADLKNLEALRSFVSGKRSAS